MILAKKYFYHQLVVVVVRVFSVNVTYYLEVVKHFQLKHRTFQEKNWHMVRVYLVK